MATLTRKHFKAIAEILNKYKNNYQINEIIADLSIYFLTQNSRFNINKFENVIKKPD